MGTGSFLFLSGLFLLHCNGKIRAVDLTPSTINACLWMRHSGISLPIFGKHLDRAEGHTNPAGLAPGLIDINLNGALFPLGLLLVRGGSQAL